MQGLISSNDYRFSSTNFNLVSFLLAFPISTSLGGQAKLFIINNILFLQFLLVLLALYYIGRTVFSPAIGAWSAIILSFYPGMFGLSRKTNPELSVTFFVILSAFIFIRWKNLPKFLRILLLFAIFVTGVFSGGLYLVFLIPLFLLHLFFCFSRPEGKKWSWAETLVFISLVLIFLNFYSNGGYTIIFSNLKDGFDEAYKNLFLRSGNWVGSGSQGIKEIFLFASQEAICPCTQSTNIGLNIKTFLFYIMEMAYYASAPFFILALFSLFFLFRDKRTDFQKKMFLGVWVGFGYLLLSLFHIKWGKFITPLLPVLALISGIFVCDYFKKLRIVKIAIFLLGLFMVVFYSYCNIGQKGYLEELYEGMVSHHPVKLRYLEIAEQIAAKINNETVTRDREKVSIIFVDADSPRFLGKGRVTDNSVRMEILIRVFLKKRYVISNFWRLSDDFYSLLKKQDFIILITNQKVEKIKDYLYKDKKESEEIKLETIYHEQLRRSVFILLVKILKST